MKCLEELLIRSNKAGLGEWSNDGGAVMLCGGLLSSLNTTEWLHSAKLRETSNNGYHGFNIQLAGNAIKMIINQSS